MIPWNSFVTPFQPQRHDMSALAGDIIDRSDREKEKRIADQLAQQHLQETTRHNRAGEAEGTRRGELEQQRLGLDYTQLLTKNALQKQQETQALLGDFAQAQRLGDVDAIAAATDKLRAAGLTVDAGAQPAQSPSPAALGGKDFYPTSHPAPLSKETALVVKDELKPKIDRRAAPEAPAETPAPVMPLGPKALVSVRQGDKDLATYDPAAIQAHHEEQVSKAFTPILKNASSKEERQAAKTAMETARGLLGTVSTEKAIETGQKEYHELMARYRKIRPDGSPAGGGVPGETPLSKQEQGRLQAMTTELNNALTQVRTNYKTPEAHSAITKGQMWLKALNEAETGTMDTAALISTLKDLNGRAPPQVEFQAMGMSAGRLAYYENLLNNAMTGKLSPELVANLKAVIQQGVQMGVAKVREAENAYNGQVDFLMPLAKPEEREGFKKGGQYAIRGSAPAAPPGKSTPVTNSKPGRSINDEMDDVLKAAGRK